MRRPRRPSHATIVAYVALFVALGGTAAFALPGRNSVDSGDIRPNAVKGSDVNERSLKGVLECPGNLRRQFGMCFDRTNQAQATWETALLACSGRGLRLPTVAEGLLVMRRVPADSGVYWTDDHDMSNNTSALVTERSGAVGPNVGVTNRFESHPYRCVTTPRD